MALTARTLLAVMTIATCAAAPAWAEDNVLEVHQQGTISYVSGGIGTDEHEALLSVQRDYNLRIMNADSTGHFYGDTHIVISDMKGNALLDADSGPLFYANLPNGRYKVEGTNGVRTRTQAVTITGRRPVQVRFMWPEIVSSTPSY